MELRHLRYLDAVAEEKSFVAAAARLRVAQPALSRQIKDLETEVGVELLSREATGSHLTVAGEAVLAIGRNILLSVKAAIERARLAEHGLVGRCTVGVGQYPLAYRLVARLIEQARSEYPGIELVVDNQSHHALWDAIAAAEVDVGLGTAPPTPQLHLAVETFAKDVIDSVVLAATHPLAKRREIKLEDLRDQPFVGLGPEVGSEPSNLVHREFAARGFEPAVTRYAASRDAVAILVRAGAGWTAVPRSMRATLSPETVAIPFADFAVPFRYVHIHRRSEDRPVVLSILGALRRAARADAGEEAAEGQEGRRTAPPDDRAGRASRVELRHLRYFTAVLEHESIGRAAEALEITQPALSRQIRDLEEDVGATLVTRTTRGVAPTLAGESLRSDARRILSAADRIASEAQRAVRGASGRVVVGVAASAMAWDVLTRAVATISTTRPSTEVSVEDVPTPRQGARLREARLDVAIGHRFPSSPELDESLVRLTLLPDALDGVLLPPSHPLATKTEIELIELVEFPFLFMKRDFSPSLYDLVLSTMSRANFTPRVEGTYDAMPSIWALVAQGLGWGLASTSQRVKPPNGVSAVPLKDFHVPWGCELAYRRNESRQAVLGVLQSIRDAAHVVASASMTSQGMKYWSQVGRAG